jgi:hypothetical protein
MSAHAEAGATDEGFAEAIRQVDGKIVRRDLG